MAEPQLSLHQAGAAVASLGFRLHNRFATESFFGGELFATPLPPLIKPAAAQRRAWPRSSRACAGAPPTPRPPWPPLSLPPPPLPPPRGSHAPSPPLSQCAASHREQHARSLSGPAKGQYRVAGEAVHRVAQGQGAAPPPCRSLACHPPSLPACHAPQEEFRQNKEKLIEQETKKRMLEEMWQDRVSIAPEEQREIEREQQQQKEAVKALKRENQEQEALLHTKAKELETVLTSRAEVRRGLCCDSASSGPAGLPRGRWLFGLACPLSARSQLTPPPHLATAGPRRAASRGGRAARRAAGRGGRARRGGGAAAATLGRAAARAA